MIQYNLRLNEDVKKKAQEFAKKRGLSENNLYQQAIESYLAQFEAEDYFEKLMNRIVTSKEKKNLLKKLRANKADVLYKEDQ